MFVDQIKIMARAGKGGDGSVSFRREKFVPRGGPDGGDGGRGGSIILRATPHQDTLAPFHYEPIIRAKNGENGRGKQCYGKSAINKVLDVPIGTLIYRLPEGVNPFAPKLQDWEIEEQEEVFEPAPVSYDPKDLELVADLDHDGAEVILCEGGNGGLGNMHFKSSRNQVPRQFTPGKPGEEGFFLLELRSIADVGLVGYPNAGKSTLLGKVSAAHPKVAPYPFTTLHPSVGMVDMGNFRNVPVADIPGLIEGAHRNVGLGHEFLRHIMRCRLLLMVLDMAGTDGRDPISDLSSLRKELSLYDPLLGEKPWFVAANKMDDPGAAETLAQLRQRFPKIEIVPISAELGEGIDDLKEALGRILGADAPKGDEPLAEPSEEL